MNAAQAQARVAGMAKVVTDHARAEANEINSKGEAEFAQAVQTVINEEKQRLREAHDKKVKQTETRHAIAKSLAINKSRLDKISERQKVMHKIEEDVKPQLATQSKNADFVTKLIVQGLLMLLEDNVTIRCRAEDQKLVAGLLERAQAEYSNQIKTQTGATKQCKLQIDSTFLDKSSLGGVVLQCKEGKILIDNTLDMRLRLVMQQAKPAIRGLLFPN